MFTLKQINITRKSESTIKHTIFLFKCFTKFSQLCNVIYCGQSILFMYSQACVKRPPLGLKNSVRCSKVVVIQRLDIEIWTINIYNGLAVVDRWPLFRDVVNTGLTVQ